MVKGLKIAPRRAAGRGEAGGANGTTSAAEGSSDFATSAAPSATSTGSISAPTPAPGTQPSMRVMAQYLKDLSFENPNAPGALGPQQKQPDIAINVNVNAKNMAPTDFEVELQLNAKASVDGKVLFNAELLYAGIFRMENFPPQMLHPAVLAECPRLLFPFARQILADATRNGGFAPLMLDPIDFYGMYQQRMQAQATAPGGAA